MTWINAASTSRRGQLCDGTTRTGHGASRISQLQTHLALENVLIEMNWLRIATHDHQFVDVRYDNLCAVPRCQRLRNRDEMVSCIGAV
jgi:hypothetical protein